MSSSTIPRLPEPPKQWTPGWMQDFIRVLTHWMVHTSSLSRAELGETAARLVTESTTVGLSDGTVLVDTTAGEVVITLPDPATVTGQRFTVKRTDTGTASAVINAAGSSVEKAASIYLFLRFSSVTLVSDGAEYWLTASVTGNARVIAPSAGSLQFTGAQPVTGRIVPGTGSLTASGGAVSRSP